MTRIKRGIISKKRHNRLFVRTKGFRMTKHRLVKVAKEADLHAGAYAFAGRKRRKRDMRSLWITRISEAVKQNGISYSVFIKQMHEKKIQLNRKMLAHLLVNKPGIFQSIVAQVKK